jgi:hypothetical protein
MKRLHVHGVTVLVVLSAAALVVSTALIAALVRDPIGVSLAFQRGDTAELAHALLDILGAAARALIRWL